MKLFQTTRDGAKWISITPALLFWIVPKGHRCKFIIKSDNWRYRLYGLCNCRFRIWMYQSHKPWSTKNLRVFIRLPFFYWEKSNGGWEFGNNTFYLWWHEMRVKSKVKVEA